MKHAVGTSYEARRRLRLWNREQKNVAKAALEPRWCVRQYWMHQTQTPTLCAVNQVEFTATTTSLSLYPPKPHKTTQLS
ncbi:hypothetical protein L914_20830 [Phytophthora nicotianae]|uniref:Uncharacterized protein n=1 Tax=Phytophthora nicotianae TaxID=4792 RepID=W2M7V0_PHYNI|nr:hypothetical protein L914_20830 [Phytophthora nicotianae]